MSELPPPSRPPEPLVFDSGGDHVAGDSDDPETASASGSIPATQDLRRELRGQTIGGRYRITGILGAGGMGTVYDAEHLGLSRPVAIKVLGPSQARKKVAVKRFQQEARAAGAIGHPNICEVYDFGLLEGGSPYLVLEKLVGETLADRIAREGQLSFNDVTEIAAQVLSGLIAAHEKGIVHRDIKPENIFLARRLSSGSIVKLLDFGVSKMMPEFQTGDDALNLTRTGMVMGTPYYMSPEQARGERDLDGSVDVYACGVVMYEAIAGVRPFLASNYNALLLAIVNTTPRPLRDFRPTIPPELEAIVERAMAKSRADRYTSAKEMSRDLSPSPVHLGDASGARLPPPPTPEERTRAPVLGGGRRPEEHEHALDDVEGTTLTSRFAEGTSSPHELVRTTTVEPTIKLTPSPGEGEGVLTFDEDVPTEVFHPGKHAAAPSGDWEDAATVIKPLERLPPDRSSSHPPPFNPEETVKLDNLGPTRRR